MKMALNNSASFFCNRECEYYPCHETQEDLNCLFCFCPLYTMTDCGGCYTFTEAGIKDCSACLLPHRPENYAYILKMIGEQVNETVSE